MTHMQITQERINSKLNEILKDYDGQQITPSLINVIRHRIENMLSANVCSPEHSDHIDVSVFCEDNMVIARPNNLYTLMVLIDEDRISDPKILEGKTDYIGSVFYYMEAKVGDTKRYLFKEHKGHFFN